MKTVMVKYPVE